jgi:histidinol phosphatase-like enzyme (inositol monophosphatase family)
VSDLPPPIDKAMLHEVVELVREAGDRTLQWFRTADLGIDRKGDGTPVTVADRDAERFLREQLVARWPDDAILGEEESDRAGTSGRVWIIDPIDGTKAFTQGVPLYSNLLALHDAHGPAIGVINLPALGETVYAARGLGCWCNGVDARVSTKAELTEAYVTASGFGAWPDAALLAMQREGTHLRTWGDGYGYALVATGRAEAMVDFVAAAWDLAPMPVIIEEAGGRFTTVEGSGGFDAGSGVASNGLVHDALLQALAP